MNYDKSRNDSEEDYFGFVEWLERETASGLQKAKGDNRAIRAVITTYLETGYKAHLTAGELVDFFCVSSPSILDKAGYSEKEADAVVKIYDEVSYRLFPQFFSDES